MVVASRRRCLAMTIDHDDLRLAIAAGAIDLAGLRRSPQAARLAGKDPLAPGALPPAAEAPKLEGVLVD